MSSEDAAYRALQDRAINLWSVVAVFMLIGIGILVVYSFSLGPLVGPGVEESFGIAVALGFVMAGVLAHIADVTYREWPMGRKAIVVNPGAASDLGISRAIVALVALGVCLAVAYLVWLLLTT